MRCKSPFLAEGQKDSVTTIICATDAKGEDTYFFLQCVTESVRWMEDILFCTSTDHQPIRAMMLSGPFSSGLIDLLSKKGIRYLRVQ